MQIYRLIILCLVLPILGGCTLAAGKALDAINKAEEVAEIRIGRITQFNNTKLELCLATAREMHQQSMMKMRDDGATEGVALADQAMAFIEKCRPELLIERARDVLRDPTVKAIEEGRIPGRSGPPQAAAL